ncbi:MAG: LamG-like jellyroll fold domain-containing protein [Bacteroidota bacterium]
MKKLITLIPVIVSAMMLINKPGIAQTKVFIPDTNFRNFLNTNYPAFMDISEDSLITDSAATVTGSFLCAGQNIADLSGIEWFFNVQWLYCYNNLLTTLPDLSAFTNLKWLHCYDNQLTSLPDLSASTGIQQLSCYNNQLTALPNLSSPNFSLQRLYCEYNQLTALPDFSSHFALQRLYCNDNLLTSLPDLDMTDLERLYCWRNELTTLPSLPDNSLKLLGCDQNQITSLPDFSGFTVLEDVYCYSNQLSSLPDFSTNTTLKVFACRYNKLDFSDARELRIINTLPLLTSISYDEQKPFGNPASYVLCEGDSVALNIVSQDSALSYQWFKGTDSIIGATDTILVIPNIAVTDSGTYTCRSYGTALLFPPMLFGPGISEFVSEPFIVSVAPKPTVGFTSLSAVCENAAAFTLTGGSPVGGAYSGTGVDSGNFDPGIAGTGIHIITYTYTDTSGCLDTATQSINIVTAYLTGTPDTTICDGDSAFIFGSYRTLAGTYYDTLTAVNGCDSVVSKDLIVISGTACSGGICIIADYPLNGNADDISGYANHGTVNGATLTTDRFGNDSSAYYFDGVDDYIDLNAPLLIANESATISAWIYYENIAVTQQLFYQSCPDNPNVIIQFRFDDSGFQIHFGNNATWLTPYSFTTYEWYHVVMKWDNYNTVTLYVNGILVDSKIYTNPLTSNAGDYIYNSIIGRGKGTNGCSFDYYQVFDGIIDDIRIYNCALDSSQINSIYQAECVPSYDTVAVTICDGDSILLGGAYQTTGGTYYDILIATNGCDSIISTNLIVSFNYNISDTLVSICDGDSALIYGTYRSIAGTYYDSLTSVDGCDSILSTNLIVGSNYNISDSAITICDGDSALIYGTYRFAAGTYNDSLTTVAGCDSIHSTMLTVIPAYIISDTPAAICDGDSVLIYGIYRLAANTYYDSLTAINGCDSVRSTVLTVNPSYSISDTPAAICDGDSALIYGIYRLAANTYYDSLTSIGGCDSIHSTVLTVNPSYSVSTSSETICDGDSVMIFGVYRKTAGTYYDTLTTANSCDSVIATTLLVNPLPSVSFSGLDTGYCTTDVAVTLTGTPAGGTFSGTGISGNQFDPSVAGAGTHTISYIYTDTSGCTNSVSQNVTINPSYVTTLSMIICDSSGTLSDTTYNDTLVSMLNGCDSVIINIITVYPAYNVNLSEDICDGDSLFAGGAWQTAPGTYYDSLTTLNSCDSVITTSMLVNALPSVSFIGLDTNYCTTDAAVTLTGTPAGGTFTGTGISGNQFDPSVAGAGTHTITYSYIDGNSCTDSAQQDVNVSACTGIENLEFINNFKIYPNPNTGEFTLEMKIPEMQDIQINITNILGESIYAKTLDNIKGNCKKQIDLRAIPTGIYNLQLINDKEVINKKIIIELHN